MYHGNVYATFSPEDALVLLEAIRHTVANDRESMRKKLSPDEYDRLVSAQARIIFVLEQALRDAEE